MRSVLEWLESAAVSSPQKVAVADPGASLSFAQLAHGARSCGSWVAAHARPREGVALFLEKSPRALSAMLGIAWAGCFYCVIDVRQPARRIEAICSVLRPAAVLTDAKNLEAAREAFSGVGVAPALIEDVCSGACDGALLDARRAQACDIDPLYVNFTSGSTGTPKGVVVSHRSVIDFIPVFAQTFGFGEDDVIANQAPFDFDVSVKDIYTSLYVGARLQLIPRPYFTQPTTLMDYLDENSVTSLTWAVSAMCFVSMMGGLEYRVPRRIRRVLFSGEVMPPKQLARWRAQLPNALYANLYGPTEITCNCSYFVVERDYAKDETIPMGKPFPNERVFLLDEDNRLVTEPHVRGEVCVSGTALGLGYLGDTQRTSLSFVQNPTNNRWLEPIYRTGDLATFDEDGNLVYSSRKDFQVKHMGQRIELGEIEAQAQAQDGIARACCVYDARRHAIHLFYLGEKDEREVAQGLLELLPSYMVPNQLHRVPEMPLTKNGKIDRAALAQMGGVR